MRETRLLTSSCFYRTMPLRTFWYGKHVRFITLKPLTIFVYSKLAVNMKEFIESRTLNKNNNSSYVLIRNYASLYFYTKKSFLSVTLKLLYIFKNFVKIYSISRQLQRLRTIISPKGFTEL